MRSKYWNNWNTQLPNLPQWIDVEHQWGFHAFKNERYHCVLYIFLVYLEGDLLFLFYTDDRKASQHLKVLQYQ